MKSENPVNNTDSIIDRIHELALQGRLNEAENLAKQLRVNGKSHVRQTVPAR